ncbi:MAG: protein translocase subunit SecD [Chloroflexota bacterium]
MGARSRRNLILTLLVVALAVVYFSTTIQIGKWKVGLPLWQTVNKGLDLQGGIHVVLDAVDTPELPVTATGVKQARDVIQRRVDALGIAEPIIQLQGERRILVELAGVKDPEEALKAIGRTALLEFRDMDGNLIITGNDLANADVQFAQSGAPVVKLNLKPEGQAKFAAATTANVGKPIMILLDGQLYQQPVVEEGGLTNPIITGYATVEQAQAIAVALNSGALPVKLDISEVRTVSGTLGADSIKSSVVAGIIGLALVALIMLGVYRMSGLVANFCLLIYGFLLLGTMVAMNATLTLPGIAGFILSVGMAVDANVITYERIREEIRLGKTVKAAIDTGYNEAMRAIIDSNLTTLIAGAVLFYFGTGPIRGFAVTLSIGIIASMLSAVVISRFILTNMARAGLIRNDNTRLYFDAASSAQ